jgi:cytochrome c peroxidase
MTRYVRAGATALVLVAATTTLALASVDIPLTPIEQLGKQLYFDKISQPGSMSCADCHGPDVGFTGPTPAINLHGAVYRGAVPERFGNRKPPASSYATLSPVFHYDADEGLFEGGNFWDGRATGEHLGNPAADQALGPFLNPVEQNAPSREFVLAKVADSKYAPLWTEVWGEPIAYGTPAEVELNYGRIGLSIAAFEGSPEVNQFSSKFDRFWWNARDAGLDVAAVSMANWTDYMNLGLDAEEVRGLALFADEGKGKCALCHVLEPSVDAYGVDAPPLFTDYSFDNLGAPKNPENYFYAMDEVYLDDGTPINPEGNAWIDPGLGGFLASQTDHPEWQAMAAENMGKHKVPTLRNVDKRPGGIAFPKAYLHNGVFKTLEDVVHFYNTRDVLTWPPPEVADNVNTDELGNLGLTDLEEQLIVMFLGTLSDGYRPHPNKGLVATSPAVFEPAALDRNPFRGTAIVRYGLLSDVRVRLQVFDVAGRHVRTLVDSYQAAGRHEARFAAEGLPSGVYFLRLGTGGATSTTRAVLVN